MSTGFYRAFEDRYRGARSVIRDRLTAYLPFITPLAQGGGATALDLGCGRGEWLELVDETGFLAEGVDLDEGMLSACHERGLRVTRDDALEVLKRRPDNSIALISAFHLVEHISFEQVQSLITEALRVLQPGGLLILETPNPENIVVGTSSFYDDPSHLRPVPPKLLSFAVEFGGFARHTVLRLQEADGIRDGAPPTLFDVLGGVSPDYGVIAQKAAPPMLMAIHDRLFSERYGIDLHEIAQRYQQQNDSVREHLSAVRERQDSDGHSLRQQMAAVDAQIRHVHQSTVAVAASVAAINASLAQNSSSAREMEERIASLGDQLPSLTARLESSLAAHTHRTSAELCAGLAEMRQKNQRALETLTQTQTRQAAIQIDAAFAKMEQMHKRAEDEAARLAAHVAWLEGRLARTEAFIEENSKRRGGLRRFRGSRANVTHVLGKVRHVLVKPGQWQYLQRPLKGLLRQAVRAVLQRPALKRVARSIVARHPRLHTRLLQFMYAPVRSEHADTTALHPLARDMSPRALGIYEELAALSKHKDN